MTATSACRILKPFGEALWLADGPMVSFHSFPYPTRMAVARLSRGRLLVWSPVPLTDRLAAEVEMLGEPAWLVSPNKLHHLFLRPWKAAYPRAAMFAPPGLRRRRKDIAFDGDLTDAPDPAWADEIDQTLFHGSFAMTEAVFFHRASRTVIFADLIRNLPRDIAKGWRGVLLRWGGVTEENPSAPSDWRSTFLKRKAARASLAKVLAWDFERVVIAHGRPIERDGNAFVRRAFAWLA